MLRRVAPLAGAMLASLVLLATASSASAEPVGFFIAGEKSEEAAKQPKFQAEKYTATITSTALSGFLFTGHSAKVSCSEFSLSGGSIAAATSELQFTQFFWPCKIIGLVATINAHDCQFKLHVLNSGPPYTGATDIVCPSGKPIEFTASSGGVPVCTLSILPQTGVEGISFENTGAGSARAITVNMNMSTVKFTQLSKSKEVCITGEYNDGIFAASDSLSASK